MKKNKTFLWIVSLIFAIGLTYLFVYIGGDIIYEKTLNDAHKFIPMEQYPVNENTENSPIAEPKVISCPTTYRNTEYGFEFNCPNGYVILEKSLEGSIGGWPHALLLLQCNPSLCQIYPLSVEVWSIESFRKNDVVFIPNLGKKIGDKFITVTGYDESTKSIIDTFKFIK